MLRTVDCLRGMFDRAQAGQPLADAESEHLKQQLAAAVGHALPAAATKAVAKPAASSGWIIQFRPHAGMLAGGNDPLRLLRELAALGQSVV